MVLMRHEIGDVLRDFRQQKGATLRHIASRANERWDTSARSNADKKKRPVKSWPPLLTPST